MLSPQVLAVSLMSLAAVAAQGSDTCPELPDTGVTIGDPVPIRPQDIPAGCSAYEILVGKCWRWFIEFDLLRKHKTLI